MNKLKEFRNHLAEAPTEVLQKELEKETVQWKRNMLIEQIELDIGNYEAARYTDWILTRMKEQREEDKREEQKRKDEDEQ